MDIAEITAIAEATPSKIVLLVMDGLGGLPHPKTGKTELETAQTPNMSALAKDSSLGLTDPVSLGIIPGSGPGHLALFGYDPVKQLIGRGILEALGIGLEVGDSDIAARGNFCTVDSAGLLTDRRAGRIPTEESAQLCKLLGQIKVKGAEIGVYPVKDHRFVVVFKGSGLNGNVTETDPQRTGVPTLKAEPLSKEAAKMAAVAEEFVEKAREKLAGRTRANMVMLRGFSAPPHLPSMNQMFKLNPAAIATYPMYRGLAQIVGMNVLKTGTTLQDEVATLTSHWAEFDFFFVHVKATDAAGEDGDFDRKAKAIEEVDKIVPSILALKPDVFMITGDHSTPAALASHSWHPVPFLLYSKYCRREGVAEFGERACARGALGRFPANQAMLLALANALKLTKFGA